MSFDENVLVLVKKIPKGRVTTYKEIARALDSRAFRAVGQALKRNAKPVEIPCHRVIHASGEVGGYAGKGSSREKAELLRMEGVEIRGGMVDLERFGYRF
ncbi:MAG: MGMT family protein [Candidatus Aenigmarchaeota archaeon]|nr:MGMT family protein [Candidatus Aenigmarchaeota archaeon]